MKTGVRFCKATPKKNQQLYSSRVSRPLELELPGSLYHVASGGGTFVGLLIAQKSSPMPSLIGLIMLMGIATKNSILLVEYAIVARPGSNGQPVVAGMLPLVLGLGAADPSFRSPMAVAVAVVGGLITSTVLSLLVVPAVFTYMDDLEQWIKRTVGRVRGRKAEPGPGLPAPAESK